jgi:hypothetical protein
MNEVPHGVAPEREKRDARDGLAAVAIALLTIALVVFLISKIV